MSTIHDEIDTVLQKFASDVTAIIRSSSLDAVRAALGAAPAAAKPAAPAKKPAVKPAPKAAPKAAPAAKVAPAAKAAPKAAKAAPVAKAAPMAAPAKAPAAAKKAAPAARPLGQKRSPEEIVKLTEKAASYIQSNPGKGVEVIGKVIGASTSDLTLPIKKLLGEGRIRFEGQRRATRYFPA